MGPTPTCHVRTSGRGIGEYEPEGRGFLPAFALSAGERRTQDAAASNWRHLLAREGILFFGVWGDNALRSSPGLFEQFFKENRTR